ncbi:MAG: segregation/condensation protein A [bacterium]|nr:segregation/condensation protein A [bacterium]
MAVAIRVEHFDGPLDLLLQLVEADELDITRISLARVAEQFVSHVHENPQIPPQELADYLLIAAKLVYMKSKLLIPSLYDEDLEEGPDLESQLREYRRFVKAAKVFELLWMNDRMMVSRPEPMRIRREGFQLPNGLNANVLFETMRRIIARLIPNEEAPKARIKRIVTIQQKIKDLLSRIRAHTKVTFREFCEGLSDRGEAVVSFLALLELEKQQHIVATQEMTFADIRLGAHPDAPADVSATDSYI